MSFDPVLKDVRTKLDKSLDSFRNELKRIRTGRALPSMLDGIHVEAYGGSRMPLIQLAQVSAPEPTQLQIKPFDKSIIKDIEKAIVNSDLGLSPSNDGAVIRLSLPPLSSERRKQLATTVKEIGEKIKVSMRGQRRDAMTAIDTIMKAQKLSEDLERKAADEVQKILKDHEGKVDAEVKAKTEDLMKL